MKITEINRQIFKLIKDEMESACEGIAEKYGLSIKYKGGGRFGPSNGTLPFEIAVLAKGGKVLSAEVTEYNQFADRLDLDPKMLGAVVRFHGSLFTITGLTMRRPRFPINALSARGTRYKLPLDGVRRAWELQEKAKKLKVAVQKPIVVSAPVVATTASDAPISTPAEHSVASTSDVLGISASDIGNVSDVFNTTA
jgi:hypothetical protein